MKTHYQKLADICDSYKTALTKVIIAKLNPVIREWANYYSTIVSKEVKVSPTVLKTSRPYKRITGNWFA
ncbi:MAG: hypothetical protein O4808_07880 [Trichodesmium sp. St17_bin3_1_1]|nr:hypothetical protein [Trichodesmium sp. St17_bin3_1_1]